METTSTLTKQAHLYALELNVEKSPLDHRFNLYWDEVKDVLTPDLIKAATRGGYRKIVRDRVVKAAGGPADFFRPVLIDVVQEHFDKQSRGVLAINAVGLLETPTQYVISAQVHLEPEVTWKGPVPGVDVPLTIDIPKMPERLLERRVEATIEQDRDESAILIPLEEGASTTTSTVVVLDCTSTIDSQIWEPGTFTNKKWDLTDQTRFLIPEMLNTLIGMKVGESRNLTVTLDERFGSDFQGKKVEQVLRINQIYKKERPLIDDDLAKTKGFPDLTAYQTATKTKCEEELIKEKNELKGVSILGKLFDKNLVEVEPIPYMWMVNKANEIYQQARSNVRTEEELIGYFSQVAREDGTPIATKQDVLAHLGQLAAQQFIHDLVLRSWGLRKQLEGESSLNNLPEYVSKVKKLLLETVTINEYEVQEESPNAPI